MSWASTSWGSAGLPRSLACFAVTRPVYSRGGGISQPSRMPGAMLLDVLPV